jgi:hypothetical protein
MLLMGFVDWVLDAVGSPGRSVDSWGVCVAPGCRRKAFYRNVVGWHVIMFDREYGPGDVVYLCRRHRRPHATPRG